jgi:hypothetical protein
MAGLDPITAPRTLSGCRNGRSALCLGGGWLDRLMSDALSAARLRHSRSALIVGGGVAVLLAGTLALWAHTGTAVFYEMIVAGLNACF